MSTGFYRLGANVVSAAVLSERQFKALMGRPRPDEDPEPVPIGDPPPEAILLDVERTPPVLTTVTAKYQGYTGDACNNCGSLRMQISGHCTVCADCGTTTGCS